MVQADRMLSSLLAGEGRGCGAPEQPRRPGPGGDSRQRAAWAEVSGDRGQTPARTRCPERGRRASALFARLQHASSGVQPARPPVPEPRPRGGHAHRPRPRPHLRRRGRGGQRANRGAGGAREARPIAARLWVGLPSLVANGDGEEAGPARRRPMSARAGRAPRRWRRQVAAAPGPGGSGQVGRSPVRPPRPADAQVSRRGRPSAAPHPRSPGTGSDRAGWRLSPGREQPHLQPAVRGGAGVRGGAPGVRRPGRRAGRLRGARC